MLAGDDAASQLSELTLIFRDQPYPVRKVIVEDAPIWLTDEEKTPQSILRMEMETSHFWYDLETKYDAFPKSTLQVEISAIQNNKKILIKKALVVNIDNRVNVAVLIPKLAEEKKELYSLWIPPEEKIKKITLIIEKDPTLARFLDLLEE